MENYPHIFDFMLKLNHVDKIESQDSRTYNAPATKRERESQV